MSNTPNYIKQMNWINIDDSLLMWQIKTKAHDVKGLEYFCFSILITSILTLLAGIVIYFIPHKNENLPIVLGALGIAGVFAISMCLGDVRRKVWLVYRLGDTGIQCYYWRAYPKSLFKTIRGLFMWGGGLLIIIGLITNLGLMVLAGPVSIVIGLVSVATTKEYEDAMVNFTFRAFTWTDVKNAAYDEKRQVIDIYYSHPLSEKDRQELIAEGHNPDTTRTDGHMYLFPTPEIIAQLVQQVEQKLPNDVSLNRNKVKLPTVV